jgi:hypothetical protein
MLYSDGTDTMKKSDYTSNIINHKIGGMNECLTMARSTWTCKHMISSGTIYIQDLTPKLCILLLMQFFIHVLSFVTTNHKVKYSHPVLKMTSFLFWAWLPCSLLGMRRAPPVMKNPLRVVKWLLSTYIVADYTSNFKSYRRVICCINTTNQRSL